LLEFGLLARRWLRVPAGSEIDAGEAGLCLGAAIGPLA